MTKSSIHLSKLNISSLWTILLDQYGTVIISRGMTIEAMMEVKLMIPMHTSINYLVHTSFWQRILYFIHSTLTLSWTFCLMLEGYSQLLFSLSSL